jgi:hypothetical protein
MLVVAANAVAQVDVEHRRTLSLQTGFAVGESEEQPGGFGAFWFNENNYPWTNTALRVFFAGIYLDGELSCFLPASPNTAVGLGAGGGAFLNGITPYREGERISTESFYGDGVNVRVFVNQTIPNPTPLPLNVRATYILDSAFYREGDSTQNFKIPENFLTHTLMAELRFGGIEPGLTARRGAELYIAAEANYRSGFEAFGPVGGLYPAEENYQRVYGSLAGKVPVKDTTVFARVGGGLGDGLDQLSSYKIGGNLLQVEPFAATLHGYYTREFFADDFVMANLAVSQRINQKHQLGLHAYVDWAMLKPVPPDAPDWHHYIGVGAGVSFRMFWNTRTLLSYGYGINAVRNGDHGGHEIGLALEKQF